MTLNIIFCIPGNKFSKQFFNSWNNLTLDLRKNKINYIVSRNYCGDVFEVRNRILGGIPERGPHQKPFNGEIKYDFLMWIDSDIIFNTEQFYKLLYANQPVNCGYYLMADKTYSTVVYKWDTDFFQKNGYFRFQKPEELQLRGIAEYVKNHTKCLADKDIDNLNAREKQLLAHRIIQSFHGKFPGDQNVINQFLVEWFGYNNNLNNIIDPNEPDVYNRAEPFRVCYSGFGFMLMKYGVMETLEYPWFKPIFHSIDKSFDFSSEDVSVCLELAQNNIPILVDPEIKVGHLKEMII